MLFSRAKATMVAQQDALPGRSEAMPVPERHAVLGSPLAPPYPDGMASLRPGNASCWATIVAMARLNSTVATSP